MDFDKWLKAEALDLLVEIRRALSGEKVVESLIKLSKEEWSNAKDDLTDQHLIRNVTSSPTKTELIRSYIAKVVTLYMGSTGVLPNGWTKETIAGDNFSTILITNKISTTKYSSNRELIKEVLVGVLGFDRYLVDYYLAKTLDGRVEGLHLVKYLSSKYGQVSNASAIELESRPDLSGKTLDDIFTKKVEETFIDEIDVVELIMSNGFFYDYLQVEAMNILNDKDLSGKAQGDLMNVVFSILRESWNEMFPSD